MTIVIAGSTSTSSCHNREIISSSSPKAKYRATVIRLSTSSSISKLNFFARLPPDIIKYIFSFDYRIPLPLCDRALHGQFTQLAESRLLPKFAPQLLGIEAKVANSMTSVQLRIRINEAVLVHLRILRTPFTLCKLNTDAGIAATVPLLPNSLLPLYYLIFHASQWEELSDMSKKHQEEKRQHNFLVERCFGSHQIF